MILYHLLLHKTAIILLQETYVHCAFSVNKTVPYLTRSVAHEADPGFLAVSPQVTVINQVVGCHYFPEPQLLSQLKRSPTWPVPISTAW